jgi:Prohead core protein serine protease
MAELDGKERDALEEGQFAVPSKGKLPIHDAEHVKLAWDMVDRTRGLTAAERSAARRHILEAAGRYGVDTSAWSKQEMTDTTVAAFEVLTDAVEASSTPMRVRFRATRTNVRNANNRIYPDAVMEDAVERANAQYVLPGRMIGESPHPKPVQAANSKTIFDTRIENSVIKVTRLFKEGNEVYCDAEVLETAKGRDLKALVAQQAWPGISMRALGDSVRREVDGVMVDVATYLDIQSFDVVMNPATDGCGALAVLTDSEIEAMLDDHVSCCPRCGEPLAPMDPDQD